MSISKSAFFGFSIAGVLLGAGCINIERHNHSGIIPYTATTCLVTGEGFHGTPVTFVQSGHEVKLCCDDCRKEFDKNPGKFLSKLH